MTSNVTSCKFAQRRVCVRRPGPLGAAGTSRARSSGRRTAPLRERDLQVARVLEKIAGENRMLITNVALAYEMHKAPYVFIVVGGRKVEEHLKGNIEALSLERSPAEVLDIDRAAEFDHGFPLTFIDRGKL